MNWYYLHRNWADYNSSDEDGDEDDDEGDDKKKLTQKNTKKQKRTKHGPNRNTICNPVTPIHLIMIMN
jgi:hypothetical protein